MAIRLGRPTVYQQDSAFDCYAPRHRYRMQDNGKMYKYVWKRDLGNVLQGTIIGCTMGKYKYLIDECMRRQFKMNDKQLGLIYYLVCLNRVVSIDDFRELPYMYGRDLSKKTVKWFVANGLMTMFGGGGGSRHLKKTYELTVKCRNIYRKYMHYCMLIEKMPTFSNDMGEDWMKSIPMNQRHGMKSYVNWASSVKRFNKEVDENMARLKAEVELEKKEGGEE